VWTRIISVTIAKTLLDGAVECGIDKGNAQLHMAFPAHFRSGLAILSYAEVPYLESVSFLL
jgi:hypothetical protein